MRVHVLSFTGDSGLAHYSVSQVRALSANGLDCTLVTARDHPVHFNSDRYETQRIFRRSRNYPVDILKFIWFEIARKPDWLIIQSTIKFTLVDALVVRTLRAAGIKCCIVVHDVLPHYPVPGSRSARTFYYSSANALIAHSEDARHRLKDMRQRKIKIVPHGVYDIFNTRDASMVDSRAALGIPDDETKLVSLFFGHLETRKGLVELIRAAKSLEHDPSFHFVIAGSESTNNDGTELSKSLDLARGLTNVTLSVGHVDFVDVSTWFEAADLVLIPYLEGTTSGVLKIAYAFSKPVLATTIGDLQEEAGNPGVTLIGARAERLESELVRTLRELHGKHIGSGLKQSEYAASTTWHSIATEVENFLRHVT